jgi:5-(carboxyamino)imidazole ribonucleotide synthase
VQDRLEQRRFLQQHGLHQVRFLAVSGAADLREAANALGLPGVLKSRRAGYDGRGQARIFQCDDVDGAWSAVGVPAVLESFVDFALEISVVLARDLRGNIRFYPVAENTHRRHVLHTTRAPARIPDALRDEACEIAATVAGALQAVGIVAVEMFVTRAGQLLVNEIAPRTHNSGHFTLGACATSQFEQHIRAIGGLPLGDPALLRPAVMLNLLGDLWHQGPPDISTMLAHPGARVHLYGKREPRPGRKMGHVLVMDDDTDEALRFLESVHDRLAGVTDATQPAEAH